jgi:hypothetical protein
MQNSSGGDCTIFLKHANATLKAFNVPQAEYGEVDEALEQLNRRANEIGPAAASVLMASPMCTVAVR